MSKGQELHDWGAGEGLSHDIITVLLDQGFSSLADLGHMTPNDVMEFFQKTGLLPLAKCLALRNAIGRLSGGGPPLHSPPERGYSPPDDPFQPGGPSPYGQHLEIAEPPRHTYQPRDALYRSQDAPYRPALEQERHTTQGADKSRPDPRHDEPDSSTALSAISVGGRDSGKSSEKFRLLLLGKTGSGKSTTGNTIFGEELFQAGTSIASVTADCELKRSDMDGREMEIMDSPGLFDTTKDHEQIGNVIIQSVAGMHPGPSAILYVIRVGRYTCEEYSAYNRLKALFDDSITRYMIVLFTGGDDLERKGESMESLVQTSTDNMRTVLAECSQRYILFNNFASDPRPQVERLLDMVRQLGRQNGGPYVCPKYMKIGESLEAEVARRMEEVDKKELERQKYVQQLQQKTEDTQQVLSKTKEEMERKEQELKSQMAKMAKKQEEQMQVMQERMEEQKVRVEKRLQEEIDLLERQKKEQQEIVEKMQQELKEMEEKRQDLEAKYKKHEQELQKKELERQKFNQQLQKQTEETLQALSKTKEEMQRKEQEQQRQIKELAQKHEEQMQLLKQQMKEQKQSDEKRLEEERALRESQLEEQKKMEERIKQQRREDQQRINEIEEKRQKLEADNKQRKVEVHEKELEQQKVVQQLHKQMEAVQQALSEAKEDIEHKKREQERQMEQLVQHQQQEMKTLRQQMEEQKLIDEKRLQEEKALQERQQEEQLKLIESLKQQKEEDQQKITEMEDKRQRLKDERVQKEREGEEWEGQRETMMKQVKDEVVEMKDTGFMNVLFRLIDVFINSLYLKLGQDSGPVN